MTTVDLRTGRMAVSVVIPLKWCDGGTEDYRIEEMARYLDGLRHAVAEVLVVDGSTPAIRRVHEQAWGRFARLLEPDESVIAAARTRRGCSTTTHGPDRGRNGKVVGALTGIHAARNESVVLADDDVRHTPTTLARLARTLQGTDGNGGADLVRPVNVFDAWPWHARWDGARTLVNVVLGADWPGTFALRRSTVLALGGWSADVLFENLELWRTVEAAGGRTVAHTDVVVWRLPPTTDQFWSQRVRQAYDDLAQPGRLLAELAILPAVVLAGRRALVVAGVVVGGAVLVAVQGRRRIGARYVPPSVPLWAPAWVFERAVCVWLALASRGAGGVRYHRRRIRVAAHSVTELRRSLVLR